MSSTSCHHCGCSEIDQDPARGDAVCTGCGSVLEDGIIVSEVQFEDNHLGGTSAVGQFVSSDGKAPSISAGAFHHGLGRESRDITLHKARKCIVQLAQQLRLNQRCIDTAVKFFQMAMKKRLTRGRKHTHVVAACVYMVCRKEGTAHMLLDISDIVQVNVYTLGKTLLYLSQALCINIPPTDPSLYIMRFAHKLEFGDKTHDVYMTALRLVQRMKRDWMHTGRRPSGLCGAALLVAGRLHEFNRTTKDIIKVVKVCEATLKKRLNEFGDTPSSHLTLEQFMSIDLEEQEDPPSFKVARKRAKCQQLEDQVDTEEATKQITKLQLQIEKALEEHRRKLQNKYTKYTQPSEEPIQEEIVTDDSHVQNAIAEETLEAIQRAINGTDEIQKPENSTTFQLLETSTKMIKIDESSKGLGPTSASLGLKESIEDCMKVNPTSEETEESGELDLTGIDDQELDYYIMNDKEVERKTDLWNKINADYIEEQQAKEEREAKEREEGTVKPEKKRRKLMRKKNSTPANTAGEAIEKMLQERRISNKINYEVLRNLNNEQADKRDSAPTVLLDATPSLMAIPEGSLASRFAPAFLGSPRKTQKTEAPETKVKRLSSIISKPKGLGNNISLFGDSNSETQVEASTTSEPDVIMESGPIQYEEQDPGSDEEGDDDGYLNAAKLLDHADENEYDCSDYEYDDS